MKNLLMPAVPILAVISAALLGCESDPSNSPVSITPSSTSVRNGDSVEFTASGGYDYTWSLAEDTGGGTVYGTLSTRTGNKTTYTSIRDVGSSPVVRVLKVTSTVEGTGGTNSLPSEWTAEAYITHLTAESTDTDTDPLTISPPACQVTVGGSQKFSASGGTGSYTWSLSTTAYGKLTSTTGDDVVYEVTIASSVSATVYLTVQSGSESEVATITHM